MSMKRVNIPKTWKMARKGKSKFVIRPLARASSSMPLLSVLRDMLAVVKTRNEARKILLNSEVSVNSRIRKDERFPVQVFDYITLAKINKTYQLVLVNKKLAVKEVPAAQAEKRICKVIGKKMLNGKKTQLNLDNGFSILHEGNVKVNDSVVVDLKSMKITKHIPLKEKSDVLVINGKNAGLAGSILSLKQTPAGKFAVIKTSLGEKEVQIKNIMATE